MIKSQKESIAEMTARLQALQDEVEKVSNITDINSITRAHTSLIESQSSSWYYLFIASSMFLTVPCPSCR